MKKILIVGGGILVGLLTAGVATIYLSLGSMLTDMIETNGTDILGTAVTVESVQVKPFDGYVSVQGFKIKNPRGFMAESIFSLAELTVLVDIHTLGSDLITVHKLSLIEPRIYYEIESPSGNNLATLARNIDAYRKRQGGGAEADNDDLAPVADAAAAPSSENSEAKLLISNFEMLGAELLSGTNVRSSQVLQKFPDFRMENIGADTNGATPAEVAGYILGIISKRMTGY
jgi:hypothetical protein